MAGMGRPFFCLGSSGPVLAPFPATGRCSSKGRAAAGCTVCGQGPDHHRATARSGRRDRASWPRLPAESVVQGWAAWGRRGSGSVSAEWTVLVGVDSERITGGPGYSGGIRRRRPAHGTRARRGTSNFSRAAASEPDLLRMCAPPTLIFALPRLQILPSTEFGAPARCGYENS